jgi:hypothetical protein
MIAEPLDLQRHRVDGFLNTAKPGLDEALVDRARRSAVHTAHDIARDQGGDGRHDEHHYCDDAEDCQERDHGRGGGKFEPATTTTSRLALDLPVGE